MFKYNYYYSSPLAGYVINFRATSRYAAYSRQGIANLKISLMLLSVRVFYLANFMTIASRSLCHLI